MKAAKKRPAKKLAITTTAKLNVSKKPSAKKRGSPTRPTVKKTASTNALPSDQREPSFVPPATYPWLHFSTVRTAGGTVSDPDAVSAVERQFEQWRRGLQRETRSAAQAAVGSRARHEAETIGFCADAMLDSIRLIHLMRFASYDDRGTPRPKVVDKECTRLEEATIGWKYHADGPFIGLFPVQAQPITFRDISEDTFTAFAHLLACWHLEQIKQVRPPRTFQLREPDVERLFELLARCDFPPKTGKVLVTQSVKSGPDYSPWLESPDFIPVMQTNKIKATNKRGYSEKSITRTKQRWAAESQVGSNHQRFRFKLATLRELGIVFPPKWNAADA